MKNIFTFPVNTKNPYDMTLYNTLEKKFNFKFTFIQNHDFHRCVSRNGAMQIMWPQSDDLKRYANTFSRLKGSIIICFVHNLHNHNGSLASDIAYENATDLIHLGMYSYNLFKRKFPDKRHWYIPHHVYDEVYNLTPNKLTFNCKTLLFCGKLRFIEELNLLNSLEVFCESNVFKIICTDPSINGRHIINLHKDYYSVQEIVDLYSNCDVILCPRVKNLNSSVQGCSLWSKPIVGPNVGNIGEFIKNSGNLSYNSIDEIPSLIQEAYDGREKFAYHNKKYTEGVLTHKVASKLFEIYKSIL